VRYHAGKLKIGGNHAEELAMASPLQSLIATGTKVWLDSVDPDLVRINSTRGATGATSNPIIIADLVKTGRFDQDLQALLGGGRASDEDVAWSLTDRIVRDAQQVFHPVWKRPLRPGLMHSKN
jgi:transaldolase